MTQPVVPPAASPPDAAGPASLPPTLPPSFAAEGAGRASLAEALLAQSSLSVSLYDAAGHVTFGNAAYERHFGLRAADVPADWSLFTDPQLAAAGITPLIRRAYAGEAVALPAVRYDAAAVVGPGARAVWTEAHAYPVRDADGAVTHVALVHVDVTRWAEAESALAERHAALLEQQLELEIANGTLQDQAVELEAQTEALHEATAALEERTRDAEAAHAAAAHSAARLAAVLEALPDAAAVYDAEWRYVLLNPAARALHAELFAAAGMTAPDALGRVAWEVFPWLAGTKFERDSRRAVAERRPVEYEEYVAPLDRWLETRIIPTAGGIVSLNHDVTARRRERAEREALLASERRAAERVARLQRLTARLNEATSPAQIADAIFEGALATVGADAGSLCVLHARADGAAEFEVVRTAGYGAEAEARYRRFPMVPGRPLSDAVRVRAPMFVASPEEWRVRWPAVEEDLTSLGFAAFVALPVVAGDHALAALSFSFRAPHDFDEATRSFLGAVGEQCALALERQRLHDAELRQSARMAALLGTIRDPFVAFDRALRYTYVNAHAERILGRPAHALLGRSVVELFPGIADSPIMHATLAVLADGEPRQVEAWSDATRGWLEARLFAAPEGVSIVFQDVTARRRAHDAAELLAEASRLLAASFDAEPAVDALAEALVPRLADRCAVVLDRRPPAERSARRLVVPLVAHDVVLGALELELDATTPRAFDDADAALAEELARRIATAVDHGRLYREAERANRAKSEFLATMSHELRTPLNAIQGHLQLLDMELHGPVLPAQREALARIGRAQRHLLGLINDVLSYARLEGGRVEYDLRDVPLAEVVRDVVPLVEPQFAAQGIALDASRDGPVVARADREKVAQVLLNLLSNALKFTPAGGRVAVALDADAVSARLHVRDTGHGVPPDKLEAIFAPFVQLRSAYDPGPGGTGLGLAISRDLARGMGGDLRVRSAPGAGSTFTLELPRA